MEELAWKFHLYTQLSRSLRRHVERHHMVLQTIDVAWLSISTIVRRRFHAAFQFLDQSNLLHCVHRIIHNPPSIFIREIHLQGESGGVSSVALTSSCFFFRSIVTGAMARIDGIE